MKKMNKYQEALDYINGEAIQEITNSYFRKHKTLDGISFEEFDKNLTKIQELVDKATPRKVTSEMLWVNIYEYNCPFCEEKVDKTDYYCSQCGQAIDWSKDE